MKKGISCLSNIIVLTILSVFLASWGQAGESPKKEEIGHKQTVAAFEISTAELKEILLEGKIPVIDVRPGEEYEMSHIPGAVSIFETELERMAQLCPDKSSGPVLYCNGPYCHKTVRVAEGLSKKGYTNIRKYQDGLPVWRALGNAAETALPGFKRVFALDKTAVFVDSRTKEEFKTGSLPGAVNLQADETEAANQDGRLPYRDHGTRIIVFGNSANQARQLAEAISQRAYWNTSYLAGSTYEDLKKAGLW